MRNKSKEIIEIVDKTHKSLKIIKPLFGKIDSVIIFAFLLAYLKLSIPNLIILGIYMFLRPKSKDSDFNLGWHSQYGRSIAF